MKKKINSVCDISLVFAKRIDREVRRVLRVPTIYVLEQK